MYTGQVVWTGIPGFCAIPSLEAIYIYSLTIRVGMVNFTSWALVSSSKWPFLGFPFHRNRPDFCGDPNWPHSDLVTPGSISLLPSLFTTAYFDCTCSVDLVGPQKWVWTGSVVSCLWLCFCWPSSWMVFLSYVSPGCLVKMQNPKLLADLLRWALWK